MSIVRISHDKEKPYVMLNRQSVQDQNLSWAARGLWCYLMSLPDNWEISVAHLSKVYQGQKHGNKRDGVRGLLKELKENGYVSIVEKREKGRISGLDYTVYESKQVVLCKQDENITYEKLKKRSPQTDIPGPVTPETVNRRQTISNDKKEIFKKNDNNVTDDRSSLTLDSIAFDPEKFILPNGSPLSLRMKRSFAKYSQEEWLKLQDNVRYFQEQVAKGMYMQNPEAYLQSCITNNYAKEDENVFQNRMYANWAKQEYKLTGLQILKTVVKFKRSVREEAESISLSLPPESFAAALDGYIYRNKG